MDTTHSSIAEYLMQTGFTYERFICGGNYGYQKTFPTENGLYYVWIHCDLENRKFNLYKEYNCGGEVASYHCDIPDKLIETDDKDAFLTWLDDKCEYYL